MTSIAQPTTRRKPSPAHGLIPLMGHGRTERLRGADTGAGRHGRTQGETLRRGREGPPRRPGREDGESRKRGTFTTGTQPNKPNR